MSIYHYITNLNSHNSSVLGQKRAILVLVEKGIYITDGGCVTNPQSSTSNHINIHWHPALRVKSRIPQGEQLYLIGARRISSEIRTKGPILPSSTKMPTSNPTILGQAYLLVSFSHAISDAKLSDGTRRL